MSSGKKPTRKPLKVMPWSKRTTLAPPSPMDTQAIIKARGKSSKPPSKAKKKQPKVEPKAEPKTKATPAPPPPSAQTVLINAIEPAKDVHREIFFNEATFGKSRTAVTAEEAQKLLEHTADAWETARIARKKAKKKGISDHQLLPEEAEYLEISSNALCLLRRSNYCVQKEIHWYRTRHNETKLQHGNFSKILKQCVSEQEQRIAQLTQELENIKTDKTCAWDILPIGKKFDDRLQALKMLTDALANLHIKTQEAKDATFAARDMIHPETTQSMPKT